MVVGLAFSHLWYNAIQKVFSSLDSGQSAVECQESGSPIQSGLSGPHEIIFSDHSNEQSVVEVQSYSAFQPDSNTSIRIDKGLDQGRKVLMEVDHELKKEIPEYDEVDMNSDESGRNENSSRFLHTGNTVYGSIVNSNGRF